MPDDRGMSRRDFLIAATAAMGAVITAIVAVPVAAMFLDPALRRAGAQGNWIKLGPAAQFGSEPTLFSISATRQDAFMKQQVKANVFGFVLEGEPVAMSNICTHLGCPVSWAADRQEFLCPCHGGVYNKQGVPIAGPPPRPLPRFETKIEDGDLYIQVT